MILITVSTQCLIISQVLILMLQILSYKLLQYKHTMLNTSLLHKTLKYKCTFTYKRMFLYYGDTSASAYILIFYSILCVCVCVCVYLLFLFYTVPSLSVVKLYVMSFMSFITRPWALSLVSVVPSIIRAEPVASSKTMSFCFLCIL